MQCMLAQQTEQFRASIVIEPVLCHTSMHAESGCRLAHREAGLRLRCRSRPFHRFCVTRDTYTVRAHAESGCRLAHREAGLRLRCRSRPFHRFCVTRDTYTVRAQTT